ncbi:hypothetical protein GOP47_0023038 [Adiantum capillus-veneris]|uniref:Kinesin motor domain-containing protein n=1 Tax=Adiantum capillus-veneris TaxID=13818 RepID=A0A9D4Z5W8_ADICA|nr:hypothetical protein GOP47_0023038 [Adiantum capillus-veneris]
MLIPKEEPRLDEPHQLRKSLQNLRTSIQSLLGSKQDLTFRWAESVRFIIEDISGDCEVPDSPSSSVPLDHIQEQSRENVEEDLYKLEGELAKLRAVLKEEESSRRHLHNKFLDLKGNVRVFCRVKPFLDDRQPSPAVPAVTPALNQLLISAAGKKKAFQLDKVFLPASSQEDVFAEIGPLVRSALDGHNVCVFAYGQTGAGKTFTMEGSKDSPGIVPRTLDLLFHQSSLDSNKHYDFTFSMLELYMGSLRDLLVPAPRRISDSSPKCLSIQMDPTGAVEVENLTEYIVKDVNEASQLYVIGSRARATARTNSNQVSSRSHCLIRITMASYEHSCEYPVLSKLWLIDLGGSERLLKTDAKGQILEEGKAINLSLSALGDVISALQKRQSHIPYRNSKLTQILRDSLGEDAKTVMLVHVSPREEDVAETMCTLSFATRARGIHLGKELSLSEKEERARLMDELRKQLEERESNCEYLRGNIQELEFLCRKKKQMLLGDGKHGMVDCTRDHLVLPAATNPVQNSDKKEQLYAAGLVVGRPRFMTATASSRLKGRSEGCHVGCFITRQSKKTTKPKHRQSMGLGCRRGAKVSPLDSNLANGQGSLLDQKLPHIVTHVGSDTKLRAHMSESKFIQRLAFPGISNNVKVTDMNANDGVRELHPSSRQVASVKSSSVSQEQTTKPVIRASSIMRRRLTVECSGQITVF